MKKVGWLINQIQKAGGDVAVVKIRAVPMCTEYKGFKGGGTGENFGHEAAGEVVEVAQPGTCKSRRSGSCSTAECMW